VRPSQNIHCKDWPCIDVRHDCYVVPDPDLDPQSFSAILISEAAPASLVDFYYAEGNPLFAQTTVQAFQDAGAHVASVQDILKLGIYLTTAVKCGKTTYSISTKTIKTCSSLLEHELGLFPNIKVLLLMGDASIRAINEIARRAGQPRVVPAGSTYKIRAGAFH
jgi:hypothetical protein